MAKSRLFDRICVLAVIAALLITALFMNGEALGITAVVSEDADSGYFTDNDLNGSWDDTSATVITLTVDGGTVSGNGAYIYDGDVHIVYAGYYVISGTLDDGSVIVDADGDDKIWIRLNGVSLSSSDSPALIIESADKVFLTLAEGTENVIADGTTYSDEATEAGMKGAIYSRDDLTINGSGTLSVTGNYRHGIVANDDLVITGGTITVTAQEDAIHANDSVRITEAELIIDAGDDGITVSNDDATDYFYMESGAITINSCYEGLEADQITIAGGSITIYPTDDGINAAGTGSSIDVTGGSITIINTTGRDADGMDSNGSINITGGTVFVSVLSDGGSTALDYGSESGGELVIDGGTVIAAGGSSMMEEVSSASAQGFVVYTGNSAEAGAIAALYTQDGEELLSAEIPAGFNALILSASDIENGESYTLTVGDTESTVTAGESTSGFGGFGGGGFGGGGQMNRGGHGGRQMQQEADKSADDESDANSESMPEDVPEPESGEMPEGMEMPESGEMPDDMEIPGSGEMPEGMTMPEAGEMPEGMEMPGSGEMPEDMTEPDFDSGQQENAPAMSEENNSDNAGTPGMRQGGRGMQDEFRQNMMPGAQDNQEEQVTVTAETWVLIGLSVIVLLIGLIFAVRTKGKVY